MELFARLLGDLLLFVYHCFDRLVIHGYLSGVSGPLQEEYFFREVVGAPAISKEVLCRRTHDYQGWVEAYACNQGIPIEWAESGVRKKDYLQLPLRRMRKRNQHGVYFILKSMEQGSTFRSSAPKYPTTDPHYRILARQRSRFTHYYFYLRDPVLGPMFSRRERAAMNLRRFYAVRQVEYCRNFIFKRHFPIHRLFERSCELGLWRLTAQKISEIFGTRLTRRLPGKLHTTLEQVEHGHHIFRAYWKNAFLKQYEKFSTFLRNELCSNNLADFGLKKGLEHLAAVRQKFLLITDRFAAFQAQTLNVHVDFPLLQRLALPVIIGTARFPGIKIHDTRMIRLMEVLLHGGTRLSGWRAAQIHQAVLTTYTLMPSRYGLNQLRDDQRYAYRLTDKGVKVAVLLVLFHQRLCGPLAHSLFRRRPDHTHHPNSKLETAFHKADNSIREIVELLEAA